MKDKIERFEVIACYRYAKEIEDWMQNKRKKDLPNAKSTDTEERRLAALLKKIKRQVIIPFLKKESQKEKEKIYSQNPEIGGILRILGIKDFTINNKKTAPSNENEMNRWEILKYEQTQKNLSKIRKIKNWLELNNYNSFEVNNNKTEAIALRNTYYELKKALVNPYLKLETIQERNEFKKSHPETDEMMELCITMGIHQDSQSASLIEILKEGKKWINNKSVKCAPSTRSKDDYERNLASCIKTINTYIINPFYILKSEKDKDEYIKQVPEVLQLNEMINNFFVFDEIEVKYSKLLEKVEAVKEWIETNERMPDSGSDDKYERSISFKIRDVRGKFLNDFYLMSPEEQQDLIKKYNTINEILEIIDWIDKAKLVIRLNQRKMKKLREKEKREGLFTEKSNRSNSHK